MSLKSADGVQNFLRCKKLKWGAVPENGVQLVTLVLTVVSAFQLDHVVSKSAVRTI